MEKLDWRLGLKQETIPVFEAVSQMRSSKAFIFVAELGKGFVYNNIVTPSLQELLGMKHTNLRNAFLYNGILLRKA